MTLVVDRPTAVVQPPIWELAATSFLPRSDAARTRRLVRLAPLGVILALQMLFSVRLHNTTQPDEALYIYTGHWYRMSWAGGAPVYSKPSSFFSGAPQLYPVFASYLDTWGGLALTRFFSTLCMASSTVAIHWLTSTLFRAQYGQKVAALAALVFAFSAPVIFLGNYATYDASAFTAIAWAAAVAAWASRQNRNLWWSALIGFLLALGAMLKYVAVTDVPFVLLVTLVGFSAVGAWRTLIRGVLAGLYMIGFLALSGLTWARADFSGVLETTLTRHVGSPKPPLVLINDVVVWAGVPLALCLLGGVLIVRKQPILTALLLAGTLFTISAQIHTTEAYSLNKHITLGLIFGTPLAGVFLTRVLRVKLGFVVVAMALWSTMIVGLQQSHRMFVDWPSTKGITNVLSYSIKADPYIRMLGDTPFPEMYYLQHQTKYWQWTQTYNGSFYYKGMVDLPAYKQALKDDYFQLVFLDGSAPLGAELMPIIKTFGYTMTQTVSATEGTQGTKNVWQIWQRFPPAKPKKSGAPK